MFPLTLFFMFDSRRLLRFRQSPPPIWYRRRVFRSTPGHPPLMWVAKPRIQCEFRHNSQFPTENSISFTHTEMRYSVSCWIEPTIKPLWLVVRSLFVFCKKQLLLAKISHVIFCRPITVTACKNKWTSNTSRKALFDYR